MAIEPAEVVITTVPITGLRAFDIGTVPASVTPPRSWRRAAWFAVGSSVAVIVALTVAVALIGRPNQWHTIDALPGLPAAREMTSTQPTDRAPADTTPAGRADTGSSAMRRSSVPPDRVVPDLSAPPTSGSREHEPSAPPTTASTSATGTSSSTRPSPVLRSTETPYLMSTVDAEQIGDRTERYYAAVVDDPNAAYAMTTGPMQGEGPDGIRQRYRDVTCVRVEKITIDPGTAQTTNVVMLTHRDGSTTTQQRILTFSPGADPRIANESSG